MAQNVAIRRAIERHIVTQVVDDALAAGYILSVDSMGEEILKPTTNKAKLIKNLLDLDDAHLYLYKRDADPAAIKSGEEGYQGWVKFVFGNSGFDVVSDYTTNLEKLLKNAYKMATRFEKGEITLAPAKSSGPKL